MSIQVDTMQQSENLTALNIYSSAFYRSKLVQCPIMALIVFLILYSRQETAMSVK